MLSCFVNMSYYNHLMLLRNERGIILESSSGGLASIWGSWNAPSAELAQKVQLINSQGWGGQVFTEATIRGPQPGDWEKSTSS